MFAKLIEAIVPLRAEAEQDPIERAKRAMDKVVKECNSDRVSLKPSPPYLPDIMMRFRDCLRFITIRQGSNSMQEPVQAEYFALAMDNLTSRCERVYGLMTRKHEQLKSWNSEARKSFTRLCLTLSHLMHELEALYPEGEFIGTSFKITKKDAANFWKKHFPGRVLVRWEEFRQGFNTEHSLPELQAAAFKSTIDLTDNGYVSVFEFDVFSRLFQPWSAIYTNWDILVRNHPGYMSFCTYQEVEQRLQDYKQKPGSYVFRFSCTRLGEWAIGYVTRKREVQQTIPEDRSFCQALVDGYRNKLYLYPNGEDYNRNLSLHVGIEPVEQVAVTPEVEKQYMGLGSHFSTCKICSDNDKELKMEPCGHFVCEPCYRLIKNAAVDADDLRDRTPKCPFCRHLVRCTEKIQLDFIVETKDDPQVMAMDESADPVYHDPDNHGTAK